MLQIDFDVNREIGGNMEFGARLFYTERDFTVRDEYNEDLSATFTIERQFNSKLSLFAELEHLTRSGRTASTFDENAFRVRVQYNLNPQSDTRSDF